MIIAFFNRHRMAAFCLASGDIFAMLLGVFSAMLLPCHAAMLLCHVHMEAKSECLPKECQKVLILSFLSLSVVAVVGRQAGREGRERQGRGRGSSHRSHCLLHVIHIMPRLANYHCWGLFSSLYIFSVIEAAFPGFSLKIFEVHIHISSLPIQVNRDRGHGLLFSRHSEYIPSSSTDFPHMSFTAARHWRHGRE